MSEKKLYLNFTPLPEGSCGGYTLPADKPIDWREFFDFYADDDLTDEGVVVRPVFMTDEEYKALPEFDGF